ncbi:hypothetical protein [Flavobacterium sp. ASW18X]|uniref:hypothetical protein n=1 Tax=Flavobacterium sp. ASW18X TaxID=2572595 RepID=UPI0010AE228F|nr:hypothetical protein [Flavobacterium sp. ASW18X]TKD60536.1 hypothetical protein FBT53_13105 [Flavobacterium sp. ASW18X]
MGFKSLDKSDKTFEVEKQHLLNTDGFSSEYCILDFKTVTPYYFNCRVCQDSSINIDHINANSFNPEKIKIELESIIELGGTGTICKIIKCDNCDTHYFVGIGYIEPNNGRDVLLLHTIIELKEKKLPTTKPKPR